MFERPKREIQSRSAVNIVRSKSITFIQRCTTDAMRSADRPRICFCRSSPVISSALKIVMKYIKRIGICLRQGFITETARLLTVYFLGFICDAPVMS